MSCPINNLAFAAGQLAVFQGGPSWTGSKDALRQYKEEILEAHQSGVSVHRIAQIFRERGVDISVPHLVRTIRRFIGEEERAGGKSSVVQRGPVTDSPEAAKLKTPVTYQVCDPPSSRVQEEEFAKQLRIARHLAAASLPPARALEAVLKARTPKKERAARKAGPKTKPELARQMAGEAELANERRRAGRVVGQKAPSSGSQQRRGGVRRGGESPEFPLEKELT